MAAFEFEVRDHVAIMTINRPEAMNALNKEVRDGMADGFKRVAEDADIRVAVITGAGEKSFSAGADLKEMAAGGISFGSPWAPREESIMGTMELWKPTIAAINGFCLGGGLELALSLDLRVAVEHAQFGLPEVARGIIPGGGGTQRIVRTVPFGIALELLMTGKRIPADEAARWGLVNRVVPADRLMDETLALAAQITANAPLAVQAVKESAYRGRQLTLAEGLRVEAFETMMVFNTEDAKEGPLAFAEKRAPNWKGR